MKKALLLLTVATLSLGMVATAGATVTTLDLVNEFSGAFPPEGTGDPWLRATFDDNGGTGTVRLTMTALNLVGTEFIDDWFFNLDPSFDLSGLTITYVSGQAANSVTTGVNAFQADGDGKFDIAFDFPPPPGTFASKFTAGETSVYDFTSAEAIDAYSFITPSASGGGNGNNRTAAHVQGIGADGANSGWIGDVPEPSSLMLLVGAGLVALGAGVRRKRA